MHAVSFSAPSPPRRTLSARGYSPRLTATLLSLIHISMADAIYERLTGDKGYFNTVIAYISESGPSGKRVKRLALMDQDGDGHQFLTSGANLVLTRCV